MTQEIHLFIIWSAATKWLDEIIGDINTNLIVKDVCEIQWSESLFSKNLSRFYGENLPAGSNKEIQIGTGNFHVVVVQDNLPAYKERMTTKGVQLVNANIFDLKTAIREKTGGGHKIHGTNTIAESIHDLWMLLGLQHKDILARPDWNGKIEIIEKNLLGAQGWGSIQELFQTLNLLCNYVVLRNFECLPNDYFMEQHGDIDLLVDSVAAVSCITNAEKVFPEEYRVHYYIKISDKLIPFDFRYVGDNYYCKSFQEDILARRVFDNRQFYVPCLEQYFYSLMYHALIHKPEFSHDYSSRLVAMAIDLDYQYIGADIDSLILLSRYFYKNSYYLIKPNDFSVFFKVQYEQYFLPDKYFVCPDSALAAVSLDDISQFSAEIRNLCDDWSGIYNFSSVRANFLRPYEEKLQGRILELGACSGAITRYLGELGCDVSSIEGNSVRANLARARTKDLENVKINEGFINQFSFDEKFDAVVISGLKNNCEFLSFSNQPTIDVLNFAINNLHENGLLLIAEDNLFALRRCSAGEKIDRIEKYEENLSDIEFKSGLLGHKDWTVLLESKGFANNQFMVPFPSYVYPVSLLTENTLTNKFFDASAFAWQSARRDPGLSFHNNFSLELAWMDVFRNNLFFDVANSFVICASRKKQGVNPHVLAYHYSSDRLLRFCKEITFSSLPVGVGVTYRSFAADLGGVGGILSYKIPNSLQYAKGQLYSSFLVKILSQDNWDINQCTFYFEKYIDFILKCGAISKTEGKVNSSTVLPGQLFDALPHNIILGDDGIFCLIDEEWSLASGVELGFLVFRGILNLLSTITYFGKSNTLKIYKKKEFLIEIFQKNQLEIDDSIIERYIRLESDLQQFVTGRLAKKFYEWYPDQELIGYNSAYLLEEKDKTISALSQKSHQVSADYIELRRKHDAADSLIGKQNKEIYEVSEWGKSLESEVRGRDITINLLNQKVSEVSNWAESLQHEAVERNEIVRDLNGKIKEVSAWASSLSDELKLNRAEVNDLELMINSRASDIAQLNGMIQRLQTQKMELNHQLDIQRKQHNLILRQLNAQLNIQAEKNYSLSCQLKDAVTLAQLMKNESRSIELEHDQLQLQLNELSTCQDSIENLTSEVQRLVYEVEYKTAELMRISNWAASIEKNPIKYAFKKFTLSVVRRLYRSLPLSVAVKQKLKNLFRRADTAPLASAIEEISFAISNPVVAGPQNSSERDIFIFAVIDWHFRIQRPQHISRGLAKLGKRVFYFSNHFFDSATPGYQMEKLSPELEIYQVKLHVSGAPTIYFDPPTSNAQIMLEQSMGVFMADLSCISSVSILQHAYWYDLVRKIPNSIKAYDCMDHHEGFGNVPEKLIAIEKNMLLESDFVIVTSTWLESFAEEYNKNRVTIRNACEYEHFCSQPESIYIDKKDRKIIGYYGAIAEWFDVELIQKIAQSQSDSLIILVGADTIGAQELLADLSNVVFTGEVPYACLPYYLYAFDICLLPFKVIPLTLATNPVKVYEYLSAGKPVVCVDLPETDQFGALVFKAATHDEFIAKIEAAWGEKNNTNERILERKKFASEQTWNHRATNISEAIVNVSLPKVSVIVLTYNNLELTKACLDSIYKYSHYSNLEVIVVDNASTDETPQYLTEFKLQHPDAIIILNNENLGFSAGNNIGLMAATGDYLVLLNNDTYVTPGWVLSMLNHLRLDDSIGIIGPITNNIGNEAKIDINYSNMEEMHKYSRAYTLNKMGHHFYLNTVAFFCVMIPRSVYEAVGPMDEKFGRGFFEDDDYCRRIEKINKKVACADDVFIHHHLSASFNKLGADVKQKLFDENKLYYESKWGAWVPHKYRA